MIEMNLNELLARKERELRVLQDEMEAIGGGKLNIRKKNGTTFFIENIDGKRKGITRDKDRANSLARKVLLKEKIRLIEQEVAVLKQACEKISGIDRDKIEEVKTWLSAIGNLDFNYSKEELNWRKKRHSHNPHRKEYLRFVTGDNVVTRSKSERFIGEFLESKGLVYIYEPELEINGHLIYPDFMVLRSDGKTAIWEHCGLMDKVEYFNKMVARINEYRKIGYVQHDNLICTYEEDLENAETLEMIYRRFLV